MSNISNITPYCVFCKKTTSDLKLFTVYYLYKCNEILIIRKKNNLARHETVLPTQINDFQQYHTVCYRRFTALPPKYRICTSASVEASCSSTLPLKEDDLSPAGQPSAINKTEITLIIENAGHNEYNSSPQKPQITENTDFVDEADMDTENNTVNKNTHMCFFCGKQRKKHRGSEDTLSIFTKKGHNSMENLAIASNDYNMILRFRNSSSADDCFYHKKCKNDYITSRESVLKQGEEKSEWHFTRDICAGAYNVVEKFVAEHIICKEQSYYLKFLNDMFIDHLKKNHVEVLSYAHRPLHLKKRLLGKYARKINIVTFKGQAIVKPIKGIRIQNEIENQNILDAAARILHEKIRQIQCHEQIKAKNFIDGECKAPEILIDFYKKIISGQNYRRRQNEKTVRLAKSFSDDLIFAVFNGNVNMSKHISFGLTLKSLTNCQKIIDIVDRYGHCCSYSTLEGLENEATFASSELSDICPEGVQTPDPYTGVAFDDYDPLVETTTGKETLHNIVKKIQIETGVTTPSPTSNVAAENENECPFYQIDDNIIDVFKIESDNITEEAAESETAESFLQVEIFRPNSQIDNNVIEGATSENARPDFQIENDITCEESDYNSSEPNHQIESNIVGEETVENEKTDINLSTGLASPSRKHKLTFDAVTCKQKRYQD